jgi:acid phosphatase (class A)
MNHKKREAIHMTPFACRPALSKSVLALAVSIALAGCTALKQHAAPGSVPEIRPGVLAGYLKPETLPDSLALVPPPPAAGSPALALDVEVSLKSLDLRGSPRWKLAARDADLAFPNAAGTFACALGLPVSEKTSPHLYMLLRRTLADAGLSTYGAKNHYQRSRPFMVNKEPTCTPKEEAHLEKDGSYPSGHTAIGWAWALILAEIAPDQADAILARGRAYGESRIVCNVHWHSDVVSGRMMGAAVVARLHAEPGFQSALAAARDEVAALLEKGGGPDPRDCQAEAAALARP